jgi:hypothetical protein
VKARTARAPSLTNWTALLISERTDFSASFFQRYFLVKYHSVSLYWSAFRTFKSALIEHIPFNWGLLINLTMSHVVSID